MNAYASLQDHHIQKMYAQQIMARAHANCRKNNTTGFSDILIWIFRPSQSVVTSDLHLWPCQSSCCSNPPSRESATDSLLEATTKVAQQLGQHAADRLRRFVEYPDGWDDGQGKALNQVSLKSLIQFLDMADFHQTDVALFMSRDGNPIINWYDPMGALVEIEVQPKSLSCFAESEDLECEIPIDAHEINEFLSRHR